eukprot:CAMPEP_0172569612 /NCGR_PEP_ID=MMETSP1067-20121228/124226_1 /TAXON_ID=265564 ORGANISM="Thalassiosira punctigera, Strain Tpunct2005C2" /NCGR_SAMPLE_ID=MMETSP1067 /ASSEMBLY_ACC=CAM_ASM_000444 /LENGTH=267 /DNA_ID=CAMNT_0013361481 /DNA_START=41 /DNA_END=841 /DNA_ORIENTATION=+
MNEEIDANPSDRDVGVFLSEASLIDWHAKMKVKMPRVFPKDDKVFGNDTGQHPYGTKLLAYFDDDDDKPMHCTVLGSRWKKDDFGGFPGMESPYVDNREPVYVILITEELSQIGLMDAHMGEEGGWRVVGWDSNVNPRFDAIALAHKNGQGADSSEEESDISVEEFGKGAEMSLQTQNRHIRRTLKRLQNEKDMKCWEQSAHGNFLVQFFLYNFSSSERDHVINFGDHTNRRMDSVGIAEKIQAFPLKASPLEYDRTNFYARVVIAR